MILNNVRLIDGTGRVWERTAIHVEGERIANVTAPVATPVDDEVLDLQGKTVIPGLINCHTHLCLDGSANPMAIFAQYTHTEIVLMAAQHAADALRAGVTTVRDLGGWQGVDLGLKKAIRTGRTPGPRMLVSGQALCVTGGQAHTNPVRLAQPWGRAVEPGGIARHLVGAQLPAVRRDLHHIDGYVFLVTHALCSRSLSVAVPCQLRRNVHCSREPRPGFLPGGLRPR